MYVRSTKLTTATYSITLRRIMPEDWMHSYCYHLGLPAFLYIKGKKNSDYVNKDCVIYWNVFEIFLYVVTVMYILCPRTRNRCELVYNVARCQRVRMKLRQNDGQRSVDNVGKFRKISGITVPHVRTARRKRTFAVTTRGRRYAEVGRHCRRASFTVNQWWLFGPNCTVYPRHACDINRAPSPARTSAPLPRAFNVHRDKSKYRRRSGDCATTSRNHGAVPPRAGQCEPVC